MKKYGIQVTVTEPSDNAYCVYQLVHDPDKTEYIRSGPVVWVDRAKPDPESRLMAAIQLGLAGKIEKTMSM